MGKEKKKKEAGRAKFWEGVTIKGREQEWGN